MASTEFAHCRCGHSIIEHYLIYTEDRHVVMGGRCKYRWKVCDCEVFEFENAWKAFWRSFWS